MARGLRHAARQQQRQQRDPYDHGDSIGDQRESSLTNTQSIAESGRAAGLDQRQLIDRRVLRCGRDLELLVVRVRDRAARQQQYEQNEPMSHG
jgi:hypothetical protein